MMMNKAKKIILVRHGSLDEQYDGCYIGSSDLPLSSEGMMEAKALGRFLKQSDIGCVYASPLLRARQTAEVALRSLPEVPVIYDGLLREVDFGAWEKLTFAQICEQYPELIEPWSSRDGEFTFPGGEKVGDFYGRIRQVKRKILDSENDNIAIFSHGGVILNLISDILGIGLHKAWSLRVDRGSVSVLCLFENGAGVLNSLNFKPVKHGY
jgi:broad specificity phosphatase PhoE